MTIETTNRIDPSIPLEDELDGQKLFDVLATGELPDNVFDVLEGLDYQTAARIYRAIKAA